MKSNASCWEAYRYTREGVRAQKVCQQAVRQGGRRRQTTYLPGLEIRNITGSLARQKKLRVLSASGTRILLWGAEKNRALASRQVHFSTADRTGSITLELDENSKIISSETFYPFGGSALWTTGKQNQSQHKTRRFSGKEKDASGLMFFGFRYYAPWLFRWQSADPAGMPDGPNRYSYVCNNPITYCDPDGCALAAATMKPGSKEHFAGLAAAIATTLPDDADNTFLTTLKGARLGTQGQYLSAQLEESNSQAEQTLKTFHHVAGGGDLGGRLSVAEGITFLTEAFTVLNKLSSSSSSRAKKLFTDLNAVNSRHKRAVNFTNIDSALSALQKMNPADDKEGKKLGKIAATVTTANILTATLKGQGKKELSRHYLALSSLTGSNCEPLDIGNITLLSKTVTNGDPNFCFPIACKNGNNPLRRVTDTEIKVLNGVHSIVSDPDGGPYTLTMKSLLPPCPSCVQALTAYTYNINNNSLMKNRDKGYRHLQISLSHAQ